MESYKQKEQGFFLRGRGSAERIKHNHPILLCFGRERRAIYPISLSHYRVLRWIIFCPCRSPGPKNHLFGDQRGLLGRGNSERSVISQHAPLAVGC